MSDLFDEYLVRITPSEAELERARRHRDQVVSSRSLNDLEGFRGYLNSGSYIKKTALRPFDDIDVVVVFDSARYSRVEDRVGTRVHDRLKLRFPGQARLQRHSVGVTFADGVRVDVVPAFESDETPGYYRLFDRDEGRWVETSVERQKAFFERRQRADRRFRAVVKLVKAWKRARRMKLGSYLVELLVAAAFDDGIPRGKDVALHDFFSWICRRQLSSPVMFDDFYRREDVAPIHAGPAIVLDPATWKNNVASGLTAAGLAELISVADRARARSGTALQETSRQRAAQIWSELLPGFPRR